MPLGQSGGNLHQDDRPGIEGFDPHDWLAFYDGGHAFLYQSAEKFGATVNLFLK